MSGITFSNLDDMEVTAMKKMALHKLIELPDDEHHKAFLTRMFKLLEEMSVTEKEDDAIPPLMKREATNATASGSDDDEEEEEDEGETASNASGTAVGPVPSSGAVLKKDEDA